MKNLGIILVILGALVLVCHFFMALGNWALLLGIVLEVAGIAGHIILNKVIK